MVFYPTTTSVPPSGDPSGVTDLARINAALAAGNIVQLNGAYTIDGPMALVSGSSLIGSGPLTTGITQKATTANGVNVVSASALSNVAVSQLTLTGPGSGSGLGILASANSGALRVERLTLANVIASGWGSHGAELDDTIMTRVDQCKFSGNAGRGLYLNGGTTARISNSWFTGNASERGFYANAAISSTLIACGSDSNAIGYELLNCSTVDLIGCDVANTAAGSSGLDGTSIKVNGCNACSVIGSFISGNSAVGLYVTGNSAGIQAQGIIETAPVGGATASIKTDAGSDLILGGVSTTTATSYAPNTIGLLAGTFCFFSSIEAGAAQVDGVATLNGGSKTSGSAPVLTAVAGTNGGAAVQLSDVTRDYMVYLEVGTAGTAFVVSMGHTSAGTDVTLHASGTATSGDVITLRLPAGWFFKWSATTATLAQSVAVGC